MNAPLTHDPEQDYIRSLEQQVEETTLRRSETVAMCEQLQQELVAVTKARDEARSIQISVLRSFSYLAAGLRNGPWNQVLRTALLKEADTFDESLLTTAKQQYAALQAKLQAVEAELLKRWTVEYEKALDEQDAIIKRMEAANDMYGWNLHEGLRFGAIEMDLAIRRVIKAMFTVGGGT